jgi:hypothetical protein
VDPTQRTIRIEVGDVVVEAELNESETAKAVWEVLPLRTRVHRWGDEVFFDIDVRAGEAADARTVMEVGEIAYWPAGPALCLFFGPTPVSRGQAPEAYSNVNPVGRVVGDARALDAVSEGAEIAVERG